MDTKNTILKKEFSEMLEFVCQLQEAALEQSELFLTEKKELEYKKRQQEFVLEDREKKKVPNISMFSPLVLDTLDEDDVSYKDEIDELSKKLLIVEQQWEKQRTICQSFEKLKRFLYDMEAFFETTKVIDKSDFFIQLIASSLNPAIPFSNHQFIILYISSRILEFSQFKSGCSLVNV